MPPRPRKSAESAPPPPDTITAGESEQQTPDAAETETAPSANEATEADATATAGPEPEESADEPAAVIQPQATYHWETPSGTAADPCRLCPPGGPPPGVGSYGCPHGQWVRVQDAP